MKMFYRLFQVFSILVLATFAFPSQAQTYTEGQSFTLTVLSNVRYGVTGKTIDKLLTPGSYPCSNATFTDPAVGTTKTCTIVGQHTTNVADNRTLVLLKNERITFGAGDKWVSKDLSAGTYTCGTALFGSNPAPSSKKNCKVVPNLVSCWPAQFAGSGTKAFFEIDDTGCVAAWYCPKQDYPVLIVATRAKCNLTTVRSFIVDLVMKPEYQSINDVMAQYGTANVWTDPALKAIWTPYTTQIKNLLK